MLIEIDISGMTEDERAILRLFCEHGGRRISADCLSERALNKSVTDGGLAMDQLLMSLSKKLYASGYTIRKVETLLTDTANPGICCEYEEYVLEKADSQSRECISRSG